MRAHRDETDIAMPLALCPVITRNRQKTRIFALRTGIGLHGEIVITSDRAELVRQVVNQLFVAERLIFRHKRMQKREFPPAHRHHFGRGIELHRAGPQRDHCPVQRQITIRETAHIAHHLGLGPVHVENRVGQVVGCAQHLFREAVLGRKILVFPGDAKGTPDRFDGRGPNPFIQRDAHATLAHATQVYAFIHRRFQHRRLQRSHIHGDCVEAGARIDFEAVFLQSLGQPHRLAVDSLGNRLEPLWAVEHRIHPRHDGQKRLRCANVRGGFLAPDMLFAGL